MRVPMSGFRLCISLLQGCWGRTSELHLERREGLSVKMLWEEVIPQGKFVPRQRGVREADSSRKRAFGVERHSTGTVPSLVSWVQAALAFHGS